jgi:hypothetical protein
VKVALMQPYFMPYFGYFQLVQAVDQFIFYDNAQYMKGGWVNRNRLLNGSAALWMTLPVKHDHFELPINQRAYLDLEKNWHAMLKVVRQNYCKSRYFDQTWSLLQSISTEHNLISDFNQHTIIRICKHIGVDAVFKKSSDLIQDRALKGPDFVAAICKTTRAETYTNSYNGRSLYDPGFFNNRSVKLEFLTPNIFSYSQFKGSFVPSLSILDVLMFNDIATVAEQLKLFKLSA